MNKLIEKALKTIPKHRSSERTREEAELAVQWLNGSLTAMQISAAIGLNSKQNAYQWLSSSLRAAFRMGLIKESKNGQ